MSDILEIAKKEYEKQKQAEENSKQKAQIANENAENLAKAKDKNEKDEKDKLKKNLDLTRENKTERNEASKATAEDLTYKSKINEKYENLNESLKDKQEKDLSTFQNSSIEDIRFNSRLLTPKQENEGTKGLITNLREETSRRIAIYSSIIENGWRKLNYSKVSSEHENGIGLGDILIDPSITHVEIEKDGQKIIAKRGIASNGRLGFLDQNGSYVATFTGDKFRILESKDIPKEDGGLLGETPFNIWLVAKYGEEEKARQEYKTTYESEKQYYSNEGLRANKELQTNNMEGIKKELLDHNIPSDEILKQYSQRSLDLLNEIKQLHNDFYNNKSRVFDFGGERDKYMAKHKELTKQLEIFIKTDIPIDIRKKEVDRVIDYGEKVCQDLGIPPSILFGILHVESGYKMLVNYSGNQKSTAAGLFQFLGNTWKDFLDTVNNREIKHKEWGQPPYTLAHRYNPYMQLYATALRIKKTSVDLNIDPNNVSKLARYNYLTHHEGFAGGKAYKKWLDALEKKGYTSKEQILSYKQNNPSEFDQLVKTNLHSTQIPKVKNDINGFLKLYFGLATSIEKMALKIDKDKETEDIQQTFDNASVATLANSPRAKVGDNTRPYRYFEGAHGISNGGAPGYKDGHGDFDQYLAVSQLNALYDSGVRTIVSLSKSKEVANAIKMLEVRDGKVLKQITGHISNTKRNNNIKLAQKVASSSKAGNIYIHCRHGAHRAPTLASDVMLAKGYATTKSEAFAKAGVNKGDFNSDTERALYNITATA